MLDDAETVSTALLAAIAARGTRASPSPCHDRRADLAGCVSRARRYGGVFRSCRRRRRAVAACTGGVGADIPISPVDHSCPNGNTCGLGRSG
jgi:hypothetical protein